VLKGSTAPGHEIVRYLKSRLRSQLAERPVARGSSIGRPSSSATRNSAENGPVRGLAPGQLIIAALVARACPSLNWGAYLLSPAKVLSHTNSPSVRADVLGAPCQAARLRRAFGSKPGNKVTLVHHDLLGAAKFQRYVHSMQAQSQPTCGCT